jgi:sugar transferase EpsL
MSGSKLGYKIVKRIMEVLVSGVMLFCLMPILVLTALLVWFSMGCPFLFKAERAGRGGRPFMMLKFRTMTNARNAHGELLPDDQRITRIGRIIRKFSIDELPQLINVLKGQMSLVGPRPLPIHYNTLYDELQATRLNVKPGLTGWCQVQYRGDGKTWEEKLEQDAYYVKRRSLLFDLRIISLTVGAMLRRLVLNRGGLSTSSAFEGRAKIEETRTHERA